MTLAVGLVSVGFAVGFAVGGAPRSTPGPMTTGALAAQVTDQTALQAARAQDPSSAAVDGVPVDSAVAVAGDSVGGPRELARFFEDEDDDDDAYERDDEDHEA